MPYLGREPQGIKANTIEGNLKVTGTISTDSMNDKLALNGSDTSSPQSNANDQIVLEAGTLDDSTHTSVVPAMVATDNLLLEDVTSSQAISGEVIGSGVPISSIAGAGTSGQFLQSQGSLLAPTFATVATGGMTHIATTEASGTSVEFTGLDSSEYFYYICMIEDSGSNSNPSYMRFYLGNDSGYYTGGWYYYSQGAYNSGDFRRAAGADYMETENQGYASGGDKYWWWEFTGTKSGAMPDTSMVVYHEYMRGNNSGNSDGNQSTQTGHGILEESSLAFTKFKFVSSSGNFSGTKKWRLFGVK